MSIVDFISNVSNDVPGVIWKLEPADNEFTSVPSKIAYDVGGLSVNVINPSCFVFI